MIGAEMIGIGDAAGIHANAIAPARDGVRAQFFDLRAGDIGAHERQFGCARHICRCPNFGHYFGSRSLTSDFSSFNSLTVALMRAWLKSLTGRFWAISSFLPSLRTGKEQIKSFSMLYEPSEQTQTECQSPGFVGFTTERTESTTAFAALAALESPRALIIAAPRCCTEVMNSPSSHALSEMTSVAALPLIFAL